MDTAFTPNHLHLKKSEALEIAWDDGISVALPLRYLRRLCPCAGCQGERDLLGRTLLPVVRTTYDGPIAANMAATRLPWNSATAWA